ILLILLILELKASPAFIPYSTTCLFKTGITPGNPKHIGQQWVLASPPNSLVQEQNIFVLVINSTCISKPIIVLYLNYLTILSYPNAALIILSSLNLFPINCNPTGNTSLLPVGIDNAQSPAKLAGVCNKAPLKLFSSRPSFPKSYGKSSTVGDNITSKSTNSLLNSSISFALNFKALE